MRLLLDTHVLLWALSDEKRLSAEAQQKLLDETNDVFVSTVSLWEAAIKKSIGKLDLNLTTLERQCGESGFTWTTVMPTDAYTVADLPWHHRDPFDRMLIAQATNGSLTLVTSDAKLSAYDVDVLLT